MPKIEGWKKTSQKGWTRRGGTQKIWLYPHKTWKLSRRTGNITNYRTTHWTVRTYNPEGKSLAHALEGRHFKTQENAQKFALKYMRRG
jgi:hypothetical protein